jgi:RNA polymerase sigma-54 factor
MTISQRLELRQGQSLVMTPQLQQAIKLLQMSNQELTAYVEREIDENPLLERDDADGDANGEAGPDLAESNAAPTDSAPEEPLPEAKAAEAMDSNFDDSWDGRDSLSSSPIGNGGLDPDFIPEDREAEVKNLRDHLNDQMFLDIQDPIDRMIGGALIDLLDEAGYLTTPIESIAEQMNCPRDRVAGVLDQMQRLDPPGLFARSLKECLALQLRDKDRLDPAMQALLDNLDLLAAGDKSGLMKRCGVDAEDLTQMIVEIRALDPKPALKFDGSRIQHVTHDILLRPQAGGGWVVELNSDTLPKVLVNHRYLAHVKAQGKADKAYIQDKLQSANWLVRALHQRATTILKVATEIVRQQDAFFLHGVQFLRPLVLREVAAAIEMHESTISRVTTNKFIATPRGVFELKYFFNSSIAHTIDGLPALAGEAVRAKIKELIGKENPAKPLSDEKLVALLEEDGVSIARRTVAKYREALHIPSSSDRRKIGKRL